LIAATRRLRPVIRVLRVIAAVIVWPRADSVIDVRLTAVTRP